ncbi:hypothetical protein MesoLjLc_68290 [Mesorhizobium sp. L-8-10]|nr:hypothetical protein MesoLjLc_68290 [Mesorhizobium sp. L-8-10]
MAGHPTCIVAMEACGSSHYWAREMARLGHQPKLIAPGYVKPFIKRQKNDAADAEAIVEAAQRPTMRFVETKSEEQQSRAIVFRTREQLVNQRTELVNALRALYEFGHVAPQGIGHLRRLAEVVEDENTELPDLVREICGDVLDRIGQLTGRLDALKKTIDALSRKAETSQRLQTMPGIGPIAALAIETFAPPMETFKCGRDFAAWLGLSRCRSRPAASNGWGKHRRWASATFAACSSSAPWPWCNGHPGRVRPRVPGLPA